MKAYVKNYNEKRINLNVSHSMFYVIDHMAQVIAINYEQVFFSLR